MPIYRMKPVEIEAVQYNGENGNVLRHWGNGAIREIPGTGALPLHLEVKESSGTWICLPGHWVIKDVEGRFSTCTDQVFTEIYEETIPF